MRQAVSLVFFLDRINRMDRILSASPTISNFDYTSGRQVFSMADTGDYVY